MHRHFIFRLFLLAAVLLGFSTTAASTPAACTQGHCVYLPLVSTPERVSLLYITAVRSPTGNGVIVGGEVHALSSTPMYSVTIQIRSYDYDGNLIAKDTASPRFAATLPSQPNPFFAEVLIQPGHSVERVDVSVIRYSLTHPRTFLPVTVNVTSFTHIGDRIELAGTLANEHPIALDDIRGVAWTQNGGDQREPQSFAARLEPFETIPFSITIDHLSDTEGDFIPCTVVAQGTVP